VTAVETVWSAKLPPEAKLMLLALVHEDGCVVRAAGRCGLLPKHGGALAESLRATGWVDDEYRIILIERPDWALKNPLRNDEPLPERMRLAVLERDGWRCTACKSPDDLQVDHVKPRAFGGTNVMANLRTLCGSCNRAKGDSLDDVGESVEDVVEDVA
jgi:hypothetical protein